MKRWSLFHNNSSYTAPIFHLLPPNFNKAIHYGGLFRKPGLIESRFTTQRSDVAEYTIDPIRMMISWQGRKQMTHPTLTPEYLTQLLANGYTDEVRAFTRRLRGKADLVLMLERIFDELLLDAVIDWEGTASQEEFLVRTETCLEEMGSFLTAMPHQWTSYVVVIDHGSEVTVEIGWQDLSVGQVLWDRWTAEVDDPVMAFASIGFLFEAKEYRCESKPTEAAEPPLYRYHPERFRAYRDYAGNLGSFYQAQVEPETGMLTLEQLNDVTRPVMEEMNRKGLTFPRKLKDDYPQPTLVSEAENSLAMAYGRFVQAGRQIMDFPPELTDMLSKTNVDDIPLNTIRLPYTSQYLYFGPQDDLQLEPGWPIDGAYVECRGPAGDIRFTVTAVPRDHHLSRLWYLLPEVQYTQELVGDFRLMDLATATDMALSDDQAELHKRKGKAGGDITEGLRQAFEQDGEAFPNGLRIEDISPKLAGERLATGTRRHPVYRAALRLVVNALCYVAAYPDDIAAAWPDGTPFKLKNKVLYGNGKGQKRAKSKLETLGYVPVHICGQQLAKQISTHVSPTTGLRHVATHWRRGHWRRQAFGPARSLRKLIWVMPVKVGSRDPDDGDTGHLYLVS